MRTYAPASTRAVLEQLLEEPSLARGVVHHEVCAARSTRARRLARLAGPADPGRAREARHRAAVHPPGRRDRGRPRRRRTSSSSRRPRRASRCATRCRSSRRSPRTRRRARCSCSPPRRSGRTRWRSSASSSRTPGSRSPPACYDGDTPAPIRSAIRKAGQVVVTNPDMLHSAILPHHTKWFQLFEQLRVIVVDELHTYRGVFGSHVANVLRRLLRLCAHYGSNPVIVCCSATIGNPAELAETLTGRPVRLIDRNGAPVGREAPAAGGPAGDRRGDRGARLGAHARPAVGAAVPAGRPPDRRVRQEPGRGRDHALEPARDAAHGPRAAAAGSAATAAATCPPSAASIERGLRDGEVLGVVSTNALELGRGHRAARRRGARRLPGLDRRRPGSRWAGPAGGATCQRRDPRRLAGPGRPVRDPPPGVRARRPAGGGAARPGQPPRAARPHPVRGVRAAVRARRVVRARARRTTCSRSSARAGTVRQADDGRWYWSSENFPASEVSLRSAAPENVVIIDTTPDRPRVLGEVDLFSAQVLVHQHAIYMHESVQYHVDRLDWGERKAYVHKIDADHYTYANRAVTLKPLDVFATAPATGGARVHGEVMVASLVTLYKKLKFVTDENVGWGPIDLPEIELQTTAYWLTAEGGGDRLAARRAGRRADRRRAGDPGRGRGAADGRPARPRPRVAGPVAAPRGADDLPVRGDARRRRAVGAAVRAPRGARRRGGATSSAPARATRAARPAPGRGWSPRWTARRSRCGSSRRSASARARRRADATARAAVA